MGDVRDLLANYFGILEENRTAKYLSCKQVPVVFNESDSTENLWKNHDTALEKFKVSDVIAGQSLLDLKIELAKRMFENCCFCERRCSVNRNLEAGNCGVKQASVSSEFLHVGEERVLIPSHTIFFSGCTFHCVFCQNWDISQVNSGLYVHPLNLVEIIHKRKLEGSRNVNWVGGDPTPNLFYILQTLKDLNHNIPQVWNSNMYCSIETMKLLDGVIDVYLTDFKYGNDDCAKRLSKVENYMKIVKRNHKKASENGELIIRHLVMPNHVDCCSKPIMDWISKNLTSSVVNIMAQYRPEYHAEDYEEISKPVLIDEFIQVKEYADKFKIHQV